MPDMAKLQPVANRVIEAAFSDGLASLAEPDRVFFLLWCYPGEIENGGFAAFFYNSPADYFFETLEALRKLGLADHAELLERAAAILFGSVVPTSTQERNAVIDQLPDDVGTDDEFDELHAAFEDRGGADRVLSVLEAWYFSQPT